MRTTMRNAWLLVLPLVLAPSTVFAQGGGFSGQFGALIGPVFSTLTSTSTDDNFTKSRNGLGGGVFIAPRVTDRLHIEVDVLVSPKGGTNTLANGPQEYRLRMLEVPVLARVSLLPSSLGRDVYVIGGVSADIRLKAARTVPMDLSSFDTDLSSSFKRAGFNVVAGAGVRPGPIRLEVRYSSSLSNIGVAASRDLRVHSWSLLFGYQLY